MTDQIKRHLRAAELYDEITALIPESSLKEAGIGWTEVRGKLDAIISLGKIEGRKSATHPDTTAENDRLIEQWQRIVDSV